MNEFRSFTLREAKLKAERYCAYQERCHSEVKQKLYEWRMNKVETDEVLVHLIEHNFLNEQRFAEAFVSGKFKIKKWGRRRLEVELKRRKISTYLIKKSIAGIAESDYLGAFHELADKKFAALRNQPPQKQKRKLFDYLTYRGWESHLVYEKINDLFN